MAQAQIVGGNFNTSYFLWNSLDEVRMGALKGVGGESLRGRVAAVQAIREEEGKSFLKATAAGLAGGALVGPVGALAGVAAGGNTSQMLFMVTTHQGAQFLAKGDPKIYELLVAESMRPKAEPLPVHSARILSGDLAGQIRRQDGLLQVFGTPGHPPVLLSGKIADLSVLESRGDEIRFQCRLKDGSSFTAEGRSGLYREMEKAWDAQKTAPYTYAFLLFLLLVFGVTCHLLGQY